MSMIVFDRFVHHGAIVPHRQRSRRPGDPARKFWRRRVRFDLVQQRAAFFHRPSFKMRGEVRVGVKRRAASNRMRDHNGVERVLLGRGIVAETPVLVGLAIGLRCAKSMA